ncbi:MAG TPA: hypothetical protein PKA13_07145 [Geminicoccaceae bacterium]|nr:hypothetical protein [Geminicoccus sp.]HMU49535.1 hypothetical protein [Geminicoccaceae bacterium]
MSASLTPRQFGVIADYMAAGQPMAVAALAAGVLPPVAEEAIAEAPWFGEVLEASRRLQAMHQPEWLDRVRRMMRGVIERAVAEERVSLLHLAARQTEAMAPEKFQREDEQRGVHALMNAMANMTHEQLDEWQMLTRRGPTWARAEAGMRASGVWPETDAADGLDAAAADGPSPGVAAAMPPSPFGDDADDPEDEMKAVLRERCPWPASPAADACASAVPGGHACRPGALPVGGFAGAPFPSEAEAADPAMAPAPEICPPSPVQRADPWPWPADPLATAPGAILPPRPPGGWNPAAPIPLPRTILSRLPPGAAVPGWIDQEPTGGWRARPT